MNTSIKQILCPWKRSSFIKGYIFGQVSMLWLLNVYPRQWSAMWCCMVCVLKLMGKKLHYALALKHRFYSNKQLKIVISAKVQLKADLHTFVKHSFRWHINSLQKHSQWELSFLNDKYNRFYFLIYSLDRMKHIWKTGKKKKYEGVKKEKKKNKSKGNALRWEINTMWKFSRRSSCIRLCAREVPAWDRRRARAPNELHLSPQRETDPRAPAPRFLLARGLRANL